MAYYEHREHINTMQHSANAPQTNWLDDNWNTVSSVMGLINPALGIATKIGGLYSSSEQRKAQKQAASDQMAFQERMSNTAHQRQVADMRAAGLNPILSAKYGGSSTPAGATYKPENKMLQWAQITSAVSTAQKLANEVKMQNMDIDMMQRRGLSPMAFKHTPFNQLGSEWLKTDHPIGKFLRGSLLTEAMNSSTAKNMLNTIKSAVKSSKGFVLDTMDKAYNNDRIIREGIDKYTKPLRIRIKKKFYLKPSQRYK